MEQSKKLSEWFSLLNEPERSKALKYCNRLDETATDLADAVMRGFTWMSTEEGYDYWKRIYNKLSCDEYVFNSLEKRIEAIEDKLKKAEELLGKLEEVTGFDAVWKDILDNFDWEKVRKCMVVTEWRWASVGGVPTVGELKSEAKSLVEDAYGRKGFAAAGGFEAEYFNSSVSLRFVLTSWSADD